MKNYSKLALPLLTALVIVGSVTSIVTVASAASTIGTPTTSNTTSSRPQMTPPSAMGKVTAINGSTITITDQKRGTTTSMTYTVDASAATVTKDQNTASTLSAIAVGDMIAVDGTVSGTTITATAIHDGFGGPGGPGDFGGHGGGAMGTVTAISGSTLTVTGKDGGVYTVDASSATVKASGTTSAVSAIKVGDTVMIQGSITTASMTAKTIEDGIPTPPSTSATSGTSTQ